MENNPLRQYFRRPAVYFRLPSGGKNYTTDVIDMPESGELPVYPMTAIDDITTKTPDALFNGTAVAELIKSCVPNIKDPWAVSSNDLDSILLAIRAASLGDTLEIETSCPKCEESGTYGINIVNILASLKPGDYDKVLEVGDLKIKMKPLSYKEMNQAALSQFELQKTILNLENMEDKDQQELLGKDALEKITLLTMKLLTDSIEYIETPNLTVSEKPFILDFLKNCDKNVYIAVRDYSTELKESSAIKPIPITCSACNNEYEQPISLNPTDFFG